MLVLGIETSCDETSAAVVEDGKKIFSQVIASSLKFHKKYGGVIPEIASRMQAEFIGEVVAKALNQAGVGLKNIGLIAVTENPGLVSSLLVGTSFAKALSLSSGVPLVYLDHIKAHIYSSFLWPNTGPQMPFVSLVVSGGHTCLFYVRSFSEIKLIGTTVDDACGEAFDKVAKILGLGYPGGTAIERLVKERSFKRINFSCGKEVSGFDFSFSGIKTAVLYYAKSHRPMARNEKINIAASFQEAVVNILAEKSLAACKKKRVKYLVVGGGVAANRRLREKLSEQAKMSDIRVYFPQKVLCTDNAAMVAGLGYRLYH